MMSPFSPIFLLLLLLTVRRSDAHSFLTDPEPYNRRFKTKSCEGSECQQACPNILRRGMKNTESNPEKVWRRGETVNIKWAKNNHRGGLMRMSIVPVDKMMDRSWHKKFAIYYGCWEQGEYHCTGQLCGSDTDNEGFKRDIVIPAVIPDGVYVFGLVWYGGLHFDRERGHFPDYFSCAYVRIQGGPLGGSYQPFFEDGDTGKFKRSDGKCDTASDEPGTCPNTGCKGRAFPAVSKAFQNGNKPDSLAPSDYGGQNAELPSAVAPPSIVAPPNTDPFSVPEPVVTEAPTSSGDRSGDTNGSRNDMVCTGTVCCPSSCGKCGGRGCSKRPGSGSNCCYTKVKRNGRDCARDPPPCNK